MAKSKNHTNHNQNHKAHKNGIKRANPHAGFSRRYMDQKYLRNLRFARKNLPKTPKFVKKPKVKKDKKATEKKVEAPKTA